MKFTATTGLSHRSADVLVRSWRIRLCQSAVRISTRYPCCKSHQSGRGRPRFAIKGLALSAFRFALSPIGFKSPPSSHVVFTSDFPASNLPASPLSSLRSFAAKQANQNLSAPIRLQTVLCLFTPFCGHSNLDYPRNPWFNFSASSFVCFVVPFSLRLFVAIPFVSLRGSNFN